MNTTTQDLTKDSHQAVERGTDAAHQMVSRAAGKADQAINAGKDAVANAEQSMDRAIDHYQEAVPASLSRAADQAENLARAGIEKARGVGQSVVSQASQMREQTVGYVREEPTKALLMAVAAGAFATLLIGWATRGNGHSRH